MTALYAVENHNIVGLESFISPDIQTALHCGNVYYEVANSNPTVYGGTNGNVTPGRSGHPISEVVPLSKSTCNQECAQY